MTKQEQIEKMNTIMQEAHNNYCEHNSCVNCPYFDKKPNLIYCENYLEATALYNAGYKQEKEVVKEIIAFLKRFEGYANIAAEQLAEQYGIKLDE